tara:strand:+ start:1488 stop:3035 length:1548 start_codon:yes stop_codon:yes gene_type:complete
MFISEKHKFLFVHVPKAAGSTISIMFKDTHGLVGEQRSDPPPLEHHKGINQILQEHPEYEDYFKFAVVRNPYERLLSGYTEFKNLPHRMNPDSTLPWPSNINQYSDFVDFCKNLENSEWIKDVHFVPQSDLLCDGEIIKVDYIARQENLFHDLNKIKDKINVSEEDLKNYIVNGEKHRQTKGVHYQGHYSQYYTEETRQIVERIYHDDFVNFGYSCDLKKQELKNNCIISQVHIPTFDPQGSLTSEQKKKLIDLSISHLRKNNPDAYIILVGHGEEPLQNTIDKCDYFDWGPAHPMDSGGTLINNPAQFTYVSKGIKHAIRKGFKYCVKTRGDSLIGIPNIADYCHKQIQSENKNIFLTQQTGDSLYKMGDCFMYGEINMLDSIWDMDNPLFHIDGLRNTGANFIKYFTGDHPPQDFDSSRKLYLDLNWEELLKEKVCFRDLYKIKFCDFRWNYHDLEKMGWDQIYSLIMDNKYNLNSILWGRKNGWHVFDDNGELISQSGICSWSYNEKSFYNK